jgi:hypothetical protein
MSPLANLQNGRRIVPHFGNAGVGLNWVLSNLQPGTYYWSVQAIDHSFVGSPFAAEQTFVIPSDRGSIVTSNGFVQISFPVAAGVSYTLQVSTNLSAWTNVTNFIANTNGSFNFADSSSLTRRFYRLSTP